MVRRDRLWPSVGIYSGGTQQRFGTLGADLTQRTHDASHLLSAHPERRLDQLAKSLFLFRGDDRIGAGDEANDGTFDFRRRRERARGNAEYRLDVGERLKVYAEGSVRLSASRGAHAIGYFALNEKDGAFRPRPAKRVKKNRRRDVVRHVPDQCISARRDVAEIDFEDVGFDDLYFGVRRESLSQEGRERAVVLDGNHAAGPLAQYVGEGAAAGADLENRLIASGSQRVGDAREDARVVEEVLAKAFANRRKRAGFFLAAQTQLRSATTVRSSRRRVSPVC